MNLHCYVRLQKRGEYNSHQKKKRLKAFSIDGEIFCNFESGYVVDIIISREIEYNGEWKWRMYERDR